MRVAEMIHLNLAELLLRFKRTSNLERGRPSSLVSPCERPWGIFNNHSYSHQVTIIPLLDSSRGWKGRERIVEISSCGGFHLLIRNMVILRLKRGGRILFRVRKLIELADLIMEWMMTNEITRVGGWQVGDLKLMWSSFLILTSQQEGILMFDLRRIHLKQLLIFFGRHSFRLKGVWLEFF
jgi:hypothetical protein